MDEGNSDFLRKGKHIAMVERVSAAIRQQAEIVAIQALSFIAADSERLGNFLAATGIGPADIRASARDPQFLVGVLDHVAQQEDLLTAFADHMGAKPGDVMRARNALGGRDWEREIP